MPVFFNVANPIAERGGEIIRGDDEMNLISNAWYRLLIGIQEKPGLFLVSMAVLGLPAQVMSNNLGRGLIYQIIIIVIYMYVSTGLYASLSEGIFNRSLPKGFWSRCNMFFEDMARAVVFLIVGRLIFHYGAFALLIPVLKTIGMEPLPGVIKALSIALFLIFDIVMIYIIPSAFTPDEKIPDFITYSFRALRKSGSQSVPIVMLILIQSIVILNLPIDWKDLTSSMPLLVFAWGLRGVTQYLVFMLACSNLVQMDKQRRDGLKG